MWTFPLLLTHCFVALSLAVAARPPATSRAAAQEEGELLALRDKVMSCLDALETHGVYRVDRRYLVFPLDGAALDPTLALARGVPGFDDVEAIGRVLDEIGAYARHEASVPAAALRTRNRFRVTCRGEEVHQSEDGVDEEHALVLLDTPSFLLDYQAHNRQLGLHEPGRLATLSVPFLLRPVGFYVSHHRDYADWLWILEQRDERGFRLRLEAPPPSPGTTSSPTLLLLVDPFTGWIRTAAAYDQGGSFSAAASFTFALIGERFVLSSVTFLHCDADHCTVATADLSEHRLPSLEKPISFPSLFVLPGTGLFDFRVEPYDFLGREPVDWPKEVQAHLEPAVLSGSVHRHEAPATTAGAVAHLNLWPIAILGSGLGLLVLAGGLRSRAQPAPNLGGRHGE